MALFLWFVDSAYRGHMSEWLRAYPGFIRSALGPGYWVMVFGTALMVLGGVLTEIGATSPRGESSSTTDDTEERALPARVPEPAGLRE